MLGKLEACYVCRISPHPASILLRLAYLAIVCERFPWYVVQAEHGLLLHVAEQIQRMFGEPVAYRHFGNRLISSFSSSPKGSLSSCSS